MNQLADQLHAYFQLTESAAYVVFLVFILEIVLLIITAVIAHNLRELRDAVAMVHLSVLKNECKVRPPDLLPGQTMKVDNERYTEGNSRGAAPGWPASH